MTKLELHQGYGTYCVHENKNVVHNQTIKCQAGLPVGFYEQCLKLVDKKCGGVGCFKHCPYRSFPDGLLLCRNSKHKKMKRNLEGLKT